MEIVRRSSSTSEMEEDNEKVKCKLILDDENSLQETVKNTLFNKFVGKLDNDESK